MNSGTGMDNKDTGSLHFGTLMTLVPATWQCQHDYWYLWTAAKL